MKKFAKMKTTILLTSAALLGLVGCSGGQGETPTPPVEEPPVVEEPTITVPLGSFVGEKGSVIPSVLSAEVGEVVTYTITPAKDYDLFDIKVNGKVVELNFDVGAGTYSFEWTVANEGMLFEPTFLHDDAIIVEGEVAVLNGDYDFYWIKGTPSSWSVSGADYEVYIDPALESISLPNWSGTEGVRVDLNVDGVVADQGIYTLPAQIIGAEGTSLTFDHNVRLAAASGEDLELNHLDVIFTTPVSGGNLFTSDVKTTLTDVNFVDGGEDDVKPLTSYTNFGDLTYFTAHNVNFGTLPMKFTHVGEVVLDGNVFGGALTIDQQVSGRSFKVINNDFSQISGPAIYISKEAGVTMTAVSEVSGNVFNDEAEFNVIHGDGVSYDSQFADSLLTITGAKVDNRIGR